MLIGADDPQPLGRLGYTRVRVTPRAPWVICEEKLLRRKRFYPISGRGPGSVLPLHAVVCSVVEGQTGSLGRSAPRHVSHG